MDVFIFTEDCAGCGVYAQPSPELAKLEFIDKPFKEIEDSDEEKI